MEDNMVGIVFGVPVVELGYAVMCMLVELS